MTNHWVDVVNLVAEATLSQVLGPLPLFLRSSAANLQDMSPSIAPAVAWAKVLMSCAPSR